jgi:hypothetical protein
MNDDLDESIGTLINSDGYTEHAVSTPWMIRLITIGNIVCQQIEHSMLHFDKDSIAPQKSDSDE